MFYYINNFAFSTTLLACAAPTLARAQNTALQTLENREQTAAQALAAQRAGEQLDQIATRKNAGLILRNLSKLRDTDLAAYNAAIKEIVKRDGLNTDVAHLFVANLGSFASAAGIMVPGSAAAAFSAEKNPYLLGDTSTTGAVVGASATLAFVGYELFFDKEFTTSAVVEQAIAGMNQTDLERTAQATLDVIAPALGMDDDRAQKAADRLVSIHKLAQLRGDKSSSLTNEFNATLTPAEKTKKAQLALILADLAAASTK